MLGFLFYYCVVLFTYAVAARSKVVTELVPNDAYENDSSGEEDGEFSLVLFVL